MYANDSDSIFYLELKSKKIYYFYIFIAYFQTKNILSEIFFKIHSWLSIILSGGMELDNGIAMEMEPRRLGCSITFLGIVVLHRLHYRYRLFLVTFHQEKACFHFKLLMILTLTLCQHTIQYIQYKHRRSYIIIYTNKWNCKGILKISCTYSSQESQPSVESFDHCIERKVNV